MQNRKPAKGKKKHFVLLESMVDKIHKIYPGLIPEGIIGNGTEIPWRFKCIPNRLRDKKIIRYDYLLTAPASDPALIN